MRAALAVTLASSEGGVVVIKKSPRSFVRARKPTTATCVEVDRMRSTPWNGVVKVGNNSSTNTETCPDPGITLDAVNPEEIPSSVVSSKMAVVAADDVFAIARPDRRDPIAPGVPATSAYIRNAVLLGDADTPASVTLTPWLDPEKITSPDALKLFASRTRRTDPTESAAGFEVSKRRALRTGTS